jgi:orotate phosphoribosyltransferase
MQQDFHFQLGDQVIVIDDLVTGAETKLEAITVLRTAGAEVQDLVVFLNRSVDAAKILKHCGVTLHAVWEFEELLDFAQISGFLKRNQREIISKYPERLRNFMANKN